MNSNLKTQPRHGCFINICAPEVGELVALCGYDSALIDMEHGAASFERIQPVVRAVQAGGAKAIVRAPEKSTRWIANLMDFGVDGVMLPLVETVEEAREYAAASLYAPAGRRGTAYPIIRASGYGVNTEKYLAEHRKNFLLILQVESKTAVDNAAQIAAIDGVDCLFVGPNDLAGSYGVFAELDHPIMSDAYDRVVAAAHAHGKLAGIIPTQKKTAADQLAAGFDWVLSGSDVMLMREAMLAHRATLD